ncbi:pentatricopeptide repeat-containing protein [Corchorus capsularis]|uniref:Pentatricopeptide repeat-containing protein n=1 Tax=Corchorus capsularis TaxID=210143 RepID=A0A1R3JEX2_COCAP|nr:pentatricopeptide repeat-containing protein [Corchorus capsularis]
MDLRYAIPPILNLILFFFLSSWNWNLAISSISVRQFSVLELAFIIIVLMLFQFFLFTSAEIPLNLTPIRLHLRVGHFSVTLTASLLASLFLPPSLFWAVYLIIIFLSPCQKKLFQLVKHIFQSFSSTVESIPSYFITISTQDEETPNADSAPPLEVDVEIGHLDGFMGDVSV